MNPMIHKELRHRMRERRAWLLPSLYLLILGAAAGSACFLATEDILSIGQKQVQGADVGIAMFMTATFTQMALLLLLAPVFSAASITIEKEQRTLPGLLTSLLSPGQIWWGKFVSALLFLVLLLVSALPILSLSFSMGGTSLRDVGLSTGIALVILASVSAIGLWCSSFFRRSVHSTAVTYAILIALTLITVLIYSILQSQWNARHAAMQSPGPPPRYLNAAIYLNPFFPLIAALSREAADRSRFPDYFISLIAFIVLGVIAALLAIRNLKRGGDAA